VDTLVSEKIRILLIKRKMTMSELADKIETTPQNLSNKLSRDNFNEKEMQSISQALGCKLNITFTLDETGEQL
jgi:transcriptional regulator with XRE-family HTH domain